MRAHREDIIVNSFLAFAPQDKSIGQRRATVAKYLFDESKDKGTLA